jgi:hypothetical protein
MTQADNEIIQGLIMASVIVIFCYLWVTFKLKK